MGFMQVAFQWALFSCMCVYVFYRPSYVHDPNVEIVSPPLCQDWGRSTRLIGRCSREKGEQGHRRGLITTRLILYLVYFPPQLKYHRSLPLPEAPAATYGAIGSTSDNARNATRIHSTGLPNGNGISHDADEDGMDDGDGRATLHESIHGVTRPVQASIMTTAEWRQAVTVAIVVLLHV